jgi:hypothetical protein
LNPAAATSDQFGPDGHENLRRIDELAQHVDPSARIRILQDALAAARWNTAWVRFRLAEALHDSGDFAAAAAEARAALADPLNSVARSFCQECIADAEAAAQNHDTAIRHFILSVLESNVNEAAWAKLRRLVQRVAPEQAPLLQFESWGVPEPMRRRYVPEPIWECAERILEPKRAERRVFATCYDVRPPPPLGSSAIHHAIARRLERPSLTEDIVIYALKGAQLHYRSGSMHVLEDGRVVTPLSTGDVPKAVLEQTPARRLRGTCAVLVDQFYAPNYAHWLLDWLPRLHIYRSLDFGSIDHVLVNSVSQPYERDHLARLGVSPEQVVEAVASPLIEPDVLLIRSANLLVFHPAFFGADWALSFLRRSLLPSETPSTKKRRLFISRSDAAGRHLEREDEVFEALRAFGVERLRLSELSAEDQACAFRDAELVVGVHGAGLANLVFCSPATAVLEIFSPLYGTTTFFDIAQARGLRYACLQGDDDLSVPPELLGSVSRYGDHSVCIEPERVRSAVAELLQSA